MRRSIVSSLCLILLTVVSLLIPVAAGATRPMAGNYLQFNRYEVNWGSMNQAEKATYVEFDPEGGYARVRPRLQDIPAGGEFEMFWNQNSGRGQSYPATNS